VGKKKSIAVRETVTPCYENTQQFFGNTLLLMILQLIKNNLKITGRKQKAPSLLRKWSFLLLCITKHSSDCVSVQYVLEDACLSCGFCLAPQFLYFYAFSWERVMLEI